MPLLLRRIVLLRRYVPFYAQTLLIAQRQYMWLCGEYFVIVIFLMITSKFVGKNSSLNVRKQFIEIIIIYCKLSLIYYPQSDGQTKHSN